MLTYGGKGWGREGLGEGRGGAGKGRGVAGESRELLEARGHSKSILPFQRTLLYCIVEPISRRMGPVYCGAYFTQDGAYLLCSYFLWGSTRYRH